MASKHFFKKLINDLMALRKKSFFLGVFVSALLFFFSSHYCFAQDFFNVERGIAIVFYKLAQLSGWLLGLSMYLLNIVVSADFYEKALFGSGAMAAINTGWAVVRDFLNLFFILILLLIAIGTILRVPNYGDKKMVAGVVLAALLINFSKPIAIVFIDVSQLAMNFFINALSFGSNQNISDVILNKLDFQNVFSGELTNKNDKSWTGEIIFCFVATVFFLIMAVMLFVLAASLLVRVVAYWVLIILSPLAMFGIALPRTFLGRLQKDWLEKMIQWSFFGPIQLFFLWLSTVILVEVGKKEIFTVNNFNIEDLSFSTESGEKIVLGAFEIVIPYIAAIYLLFYGYDASKSAAATGAKSVMNWGSQKMEHYGKKFRKAAIFGGVGALAVGGAGLAGVGALAGGAAGYYGGRAAGRAFGRKAKDSAEGLRQKWAEKGKVAGFFLKNKKEREEAIAEKRAERVAEIKGGEEKKKYWRGRANKQKKEWDDLGMDETFLKEKMTKGNPAERKAAVLLLAEQGKIKDGEVFEKALTALDGDQVLEGTVRKKLKEENIYAFMSHDVDKAWEALTGSSDERMHELLENNTNLKDLLVKEGVNTKDKDKVNKRLKEYKEAGLEGQDGFKQKAYDKQLNELSPKQLAQQSMDLYDKEEIILQNYFAKHMKFSKKDPQGSKSRFEFEKELDRQGNGARATKAKDLIEKAQKQRMGSAGGTENTSNTDDAENIITTA